MPKEIAELPIVSCYARPDDDRDAPYERLVEAVTAGKLKAHVWYIEHDAGEQANDLAGSQVRLPYFFVGEAPDGGKTWPKHRCGGAAFLRVWLNGRPVAEVQQGLKAAAKTAVREEQVGVPQAAPYAERSSEWYDEKLKDAMQIAADAQQSLKDERATTRALRKAGKELVDQIAGCNMLLAEATQRADYQAEELTKCSAMLATSTKALRRIEDRVDVAIGCVDKMALAGEHSLEQRDHALAELRSAQALANTELPGGWVALGA